MKKISHFWHWVIDPLIVVGPKIFPFVLMEIILYRFQFRLIRKIHYFCCKQIQKIVQLYLSQHYQDVIKKYQFIEESVELDHENDPIWVMWLQGLEQAPEIVKICLCSIRKNASGHDVILLTEKNINNYIKLPSIIEEKYRKDFISKTHYSDIVRATLISKYGGLWLDATVFVSNPISKEYFNNSFFSFKRENLEMPFLYSKEMWTAFVFGDSKNGAVSSFLRDFFYSYWEKEDRLVHFWLIDHIIYLGYQEVPAIRRAIDKINEENYDVGELVPLLRTGDLYDKINEMLLLHSFHKLSWKETLNASVLLNYLNKENCLDV